MSDVNLKKPLVYQGKEAKVLHTFKSGKIAVLVEGLDTVLTFRNYGCPAQDAWCTEGSPDRMTNAPEKKVYVIDVYPTTGASYKRSNDANGPINSQYKDTFRVRVTEIDGVITSREIVA